MLCNVIEDIREGAEIVVYYHKHYFGDFNVNCLCPFKSHRLQVSQNISPTIYQGREKQKKRKTHEILIFVCQRLKTSSEDFNYFLPITLAIFKCSVYFY